MTALRSRAWSRWLAVYKWLCGHPPAVRPWHVRWLASAPLADDLRGQLTPLTGSVLDVGCGASPYERWLSQADEYVGLDINPGPRVDVVVEPGKRWPVPAGHFDAALCTQVLQYVDDPGHFASELARTVKSGGQVILTTPWIYNEDAADRDYWRLSPHGVQRILGSGFEVVDVRRQGGVGSSIGQLFLNWLDTSLKKSTARLVVLTIFLPLWLAFCGVVNLLAIVLDRFDRSDRFYGNVLVVARRRDFAHPADDGFDSE